MHHIVTVETYSLNTGVLLVTLRPDMTEGFHGFFFCSVREISVKYLNTSKSVSSTHFPFYCLKYPLCFRYLAYEVEKTALYE